MSEATAAPAPPAPAKPAPPAEFPPPVKATIGWLHQKFCDWYRANPPRPPDRFTRREFGYMAWPERPGPPPFVRHIGFDSIERFHEALAKGGPHSVYYSTAYYRRPGEMKMADKQWLGAELIFDLDADHLEEVEKAKAEGREVPLAEQLRQVKQLFIRLLDDYLFGDFGLSSNDVWITFSGGRGYHAHVVEESLMQLGSRERREIVDYVTGKFPTERGTDKPDYDSLVHFEIVDYDQFGKHVKPIKRERIAPISTPGWPGRITKGIAEALEKNVLGQPREQAKRWLMSFEGVGEKKADAFLSGFTPEKLDRIRSGFLYQGDMVMRFMEKAIPNRGVALSKHGETDEPVTADTKRLIRLPGSLHGKSGLRVVTLTRDQLDGFDPLRDAVAFSMAEQVVLKPRKDQEMTLGGERVAVKEGVPTPVPEAHAVFWCARQGGTVVPRPA